MFYVVPIVSAVLALIVGVRLGINCRFGAASGLGALGGAGFGLAIMLGRQHQGWDGIGYVIVAVLLIAPAVLGLGVGVLIGWLRQRRTG
jgi:hypothetical protein